MKLYKIVGTMVASAAACLLLATQASATVSPPGGGSWDHTWTTTDSAHGGTLYVEEHGDVIVLCDTAADGLAAHAAVNYATASSSSEYFMVTSGGNGTCVEQEASDGGIFDLPEGVDIDVTIGLGSASAGMKDWTSVYPTYFLNDN